MFDGARPVGRRVDGALPIVGDHGIPECIDSTPPIVGDHGIPEHVERCSTHDLLGISFIW